MNTLLEPFQYAFFRHAIVVAVLAGTLCGSWVSTSCSAG